MPSGGGGGGGGVGAAPSGAGKGIATVPHQGPYDPSGDVIGQLLGIAGGSMNNPGTVVTSGGVNNSGVRAALRQSYAQEEANRRSVYDQINAAIQGRAPGISAGYDQAGRVLEDNARQRAIADMGNLSTLQQEAAQAASALGLSIVPSATDRTQAAQQAAQQKYQSIADSWQGFDQAGKQLALQRNTATGDAFTHAGTIQQQNLAAELNAALARAADRGGSSRVVGASSISASAAAKIYNDILNQLNNQKRTGIAAAGLRPTVTQTDSNRGGVKSHSTTVKSKG